MPRSDEQNEAVRAESRAKIMNAALGLFSQHGYEQTSIRMIAQAAGISQGLMYNYFESKEHLLAEIFRASMRDVRESFAVAEAAAPGERIEALIRGAFGILRRNLDFWRLSYAVRMQSPALAALGDDVRAWTEQIHRTLAGYFREAGAPNPEVEAAILFALIDGVSQHFALDPQRYPLDAVADALVARYRNA
ncbi:MAG TPA: TetR/AcrR family transcriptional regulator [Roseiflexaceae bacterium]|nr:TetR/AcrR family transcriptional regulator [Roseiflexaceae bacterium]